MAVEQYTSYTQSALRLRRVGGPILVGPPSMYNSSFQQKINVFTQKLKWCTCNCNLSTIKTYKEWHD